MGSRENPPLPPYPTPTECCWKTDTFTGIVFCLEGPSLMGIGSCCRSPASPDPFPCTLPPQDETVNHAVEIHYTGTHKCECAPCEGEEEERVTLKDCEQQEGIRIIMHPPRSLGHAQRRSNLVREFTYYHKYKDGECLDEVNRDPISNPEGHGGERGSTSADKCEWDETFDCKLRIAADGCIKKAFDENSPDACWQFSEPYHSPLDEAIKDCSKVETDPDFGGPVEYPPCIRFNNSLVKCLTENLCCGSPHPTPLDPEGTAIEMLKILLNCGGDPPPGGEEIIGFKENECGEEEEEEEEEG